MAGAIIIVVVLLLIPVLVLMSGAIASAIIGESMEMDSESRRLFEFVLLEGAQAGLSWSTILRKRDGYARCFAGFDPAAVAAFGDDDVARCLADAGIVRNRAKVNAAVGNARAWLELDDPVAFLWDFVGGAGDGLSLIHI